MNFTTRAASIFALSLALISLAPGAARAADTLRDFCRMLENPKIPTGLRRVPYVPVTFGAAFGDPALGFCEVHPDTSIPLASTTKVLTATAALLHLNPERPFDPRVRWQEISPGNPSAIANLEVTGDGGVEPWTPARFKKVVDHLVQMGVREIRGAKARASDPRWRSVRIPNWPAEDYSPTEENDCSVPLPRPFHFAGSACVEVIVTGPSSAEWADFAVPFEQRVPIRREAPEAPYSLHFEPGPAGREASGALVIRGQPKLARRAVTSFRVAYRDSEAVATALLRKALDGRILVIDPDREYPLPPSSHPWLEEPIETEPLLPLLSRFLKASINDVGEHLLRKVGIAYFAPTARMAVSREPTPYNDSLKAGQEALERVAKSLVPELGPDDLNVEDGCGLSLQTRAKARAQQGLLLAIRDHASLFPRIKDALARPGGPGTLESRLLHLSSRLRGKTGTLWNGGTHSLVGYVRLTAATGNLPADWIPFVTISKIADTYPGDMKAAGRKVRAKINEAITAYAEVLPQRKRAPRP